MLNHRLSDWRDRGRFEEFRGRRIYVHAAGPPPPEPERKGLLRRRAEPDPAPLILLLHGFPSSSYDWRPLLRVGLGGHEALAFDFLGFGLSDKPADHDYSLLWQADLAEELVNRHHPGRPVVIAAHDMGTTVANELMARDLDGNSRIDLRGVLLFNGSMVQSAAAPTLAQKILRGRFGGVLARLTSERIFRQQFGSIFSEAHPLTDADAEDQWALLTHNDGHRIGNLTIAYMDEREERAARWHGAISQWPGTLHLAWALDDPVANLDVLAAVRELRPSVPVTELPGLGHYPQIEDPGRIAQAVRALVGASL